MDESDGITFGDIMLSWAIFFAEVVILTLNSFKEVLISTFRLLIPPSQVSVKGEKVLITGTGHGIGKELARQYGELGAEVICVDINAETNEQTVSELRKIGIKATGFECDVSKREKVLELQKKVKASVGDVTIIVNNAGIMPTKSFQKHTPEDIIRIYEINVFAHYWILEAFLPSMLVKNYGHIVGISSVAGKVGFPYVSVYCGSKFAVAGSMEAIAEEFRAQKKNIKFTTIYPHMTDTGLCGKVRVRFPGLFSMQDPKVVAREIIKAQRRGYRETMIPGFMNPLHNFGRVLPEKVQMDLIDFIDSGLLAE